MYACLYDETISIMLRSLRKPKRMSAAIHINQLEIDLDNYQVWHDGQSIRLTRTEWALLGELVKHKNQILSHQTLLQRVWGHEYHDEFDYVHTYISRLRRKLEANSSDPQIILTEPGIGYRFQAVDHHNGAAATQPETQSTTQTARVLKTINPLPQTTERYIGRQFERDEIQELLRNQARLVSIYGRAGVGKTALACRVIHELQQHTADWDGMVFLSANSTGINLPRIFSDFSKLSSIQWDEAPQDRSATVQRITALLDQLRDGRYLLLLDNLETIQKPATGELLDTDMQLFFRLVLEQESGLQLLVTSREPLSLPRSAKTWERVISLDAGLSIPDAVTLLRRCDPDNSAGLKNASDEQLQIIAERTQGFPRALEAVVGLLLEDQLLTIESLLNNTHSLSGEINEVLVQNALERLDAEAMRVMEVAAAFKRPVSQPALAHILNQFDFQGNLHTILNRLIRGYFLEFSRDSGVFSMHPIDQNYCYQNIPDDAALPYSRQSLHQAIAAYFRQQQADNVQSIDQLDQQQQVFNHMVDGGDYETAAALLINMDSQYLSRGGYYAELSEMYTRILNHMQNGDLARAVWLKAGEAYRGAGRLQEALNCYERAFKSAKQAHEQQVMAQAVSNMGWVNYDQGHFGLALTHWQQAIEIFESLSDKSGIANARGGMGWVSYLQGNYEQAVENFQQAVNIFTRLEDKLGVGINLGDMGVVAMAQGQYQEAIKLLDQAYHIAEDTDSLREQSYKGSYLAIAHLLSGDLQAAQNIIKIIAQYEEVPVNRPMVKALQGIILTCLSQSEAAILAFQDAIRYADHLLNTTVGLYHVRYARSLANAGLCLLDNHDVDDTLLDYGKGKAICGEPGVIRLQLKLLDAMIHCAGSDQLQPVQNLLRQDLSA